MDMVELYERKHRSIGLADPIEAISTCMDDLDLKAIDLGKNGGKTGMYSVKVYNTPSRGFVPWAFSEENP